LLKTLKPRFLNPFLQHWSVYPVLGSSAIDCTIFISCVDQFLIEEYDDNGDDEDDDGDVVVEVYLFQQAKNL